MLTKEEIVNTLKASIKDLREKYGFERIHLFGSYVNGIPTEKSDIDLAVDVRDRSFKKLKNYINAIEDLKNKFNREIDLVYIDQDCVNPIILKEITERSITIE